MTKESIQARLEILRAEREKVLQQLAAYNGAIGELERLIAPPDPPPLTETV